MGQSQPHRLKILVVDDDDDVRETACGLLKVEGYTVLSAGGGREALALLDAHPDTALLFTDIVMPGGIDGFDLAERAKLKYPRLRVIYTSGYLMDEGVWDGALLRKPWTPDDLRSAMTELSA
jgi:CheY-like chemotaxis protein